MNENNKALLLARIARVQEFIESLKYAVEAGDRNTGDFASNLARQMKLLLDEVEAANDGC